MFWKKKNFDELMREAFTQDYSESIDHSKRFLMLKELSKHEQLIQYLKSRYAVIYRSAVFDRAQDSTEYQRGVYAGRVIEMYNLLHDIDTASKVDMAEYLKRLDVAEKRREYFGAEQKNFGEFIPWPNK